MKVADLTAVLAVDDGALDRDVDAAMGRAGQSMAAGGDAAGAGFGESAGSGMSGRLGSWVGKLGTLLAAGALAAGAVLGAAVADGFSTAVDLHAGTGRIQAQMGLSDEQAATYGAAAGKVYGANFGESLEEAQTAVAAVGSTLADSLGDGDDALERTAERALTFASVFGVDVETAVSTAGIAIRSGLADDAEHAFDLMTTASQRMPAAMRAELIPAVEEYGGFLASLGYTGEEAFGLLAEASKDGQFGVDKTADALKELTIRGTDMSEASVTAYEAAGLKAEEMAQKIAAGGPAAREATDQIVAGLQGIDDPVERANAAIALFGTPLEDLGVSGIPDFLASLSTMESGLDDVAGATDKAAEDSAQGLGTWVEGMKRRGQMGIANFLTGIGDAFQAGGLQGVADHLGDMWDRAYPVVETKARELLRLAGDWITQEGPGVARKFGEALIVGADWLIQQYPAFAQRMAEFWGRIITWVAEVAVPWLGDAAMALGPALWQWLQDAYPAWVRRMAELYVQIGGWIVGTGIPWLLRKGAELWAALFEWLWTEAVPALWRGLGSLIAAIGEWLAGTAIPWLRQNAGVWWDALRAKAAEKGGEALAWLRTLPGTIATWITGTALPALRTKASEWFAALKEKAAEKGEEALTWMRELPGRILTAVGSLGATLLQAGRDLVQGLIDGIKAKAGDLMDAAADLAGPLAPLVRGIFDSRSPSRVFMAIGGDIVDGLALGIEQKRKTAGLSLTGIGADLARMGRQLDAEVRTGVQGPGGFGGPSLAGVAGIGQAPIVLNLRAELSIGGEKIDERIETHLEADDAETDRLVRVGEGANG